MSSFEDTERMIAELGKDSGPSKKKQKDDMDDILADLNSSMGSLNKGNANKQASKSVKTESDLNALEKQLYAEHGPIEFEINDIWLWDIFGFLGVHFAGLLAEGV